MRALLENVCDILLLYLDTLGCQIANFAVLLALCSLTCSVLSTTVSGSQLKMSPPIVKPPNSFMGS